MDTERKKATLDLIRRFSDDGQSTPSALIFHSSRNDLSPISNDVTEPHLKRFLSLDPDFNGIRMTVLKSFNLKDRPEKSSPVSAANDSYDPIYLASGGGNSDNGIIMSSKKIENQDRQPAGHLSAKHTGSRVHFPGDLADPSSIKDIDRMAVTRRQSIPPTGVVAGRGSVADDRKESISIQTETEHHPSIPTQASHLIAELSKHLSVLYCILITITSASLSVASTITHNMDNSVSRWFDSAMLAVGILWLIFAFFYLFRRPNSSPIPSAKTRIHIINYPQSNHPEDVHRVVRYRYVENEVDSGSFYLKMGATAFAVGSMIYACLDIGVFAENLACLSPVVGLYPMLFIVYVLLQLYFIFKNSQFKITSCRALSRFGLAHLVATDICVWIRTLLDETIHEFAELKAKQIIKTGGNKTSGFLDFVVTEQEVKSALETGHILDVESPNGLEPHPGDRGFASLCVNGDSMMHEMKEAAAMFLYPCMIEYALITAGIVYIMWHAVEKHHPKKADHDSGTDSRRHPRMFSVDCSHAANGLFAGVVLIVLTIVGLIFYFLYVNHDAPDSEYMAGLCADIMDVGLNTIGLCAVLYCSWQFAMKLGRIHVHNPNMELDDGLLILTMIGVYAYTIMNIIGTLAGDMMNVLSLVGDFLEILQTTVQTIFIFDASKRALTNPTPSRRNSNRRSSTDKKKSTPTVRFDKPGREMLTLLLGVNFSQWAIDIMCTLRAETNPVPKEFFGTQQWATMLHVTVPLVIFYRFHSTVCLFDIWKHAYKVHRRTAQNVQHVA